MDKKKHTYTNALIHETSPYLLQHAHNPVNWEAWNEKSLARAKTENKLLLISIGYSACHWCHVMELESFEDESVAKIMNENYVCIKIDREERPDIDQIYMHAVQLMSRHGGWPLNCFALPDGKPVYGGTYFTNSQWKNILLQVAHLWKTDNTKFKMYASELTDGIKKADFIKLNTDSENDSYTKDMLQEFYSSLAAGFDKTDGGFSRIPKFPLPNNYEFLLRYQYHTHDNACLEQILLTLDKMANGGIYDQVGGGFARYSTDKLWKVPHFEKMLYDNAQLVSLYSQAFQLTKNERYKNVVYQTLAFTDREMTSEDNGFFSALDADSEGEEGKFYVWQKEEIEALLLEKSKLFCDAYHVGEIGYWEKENYILMRNDDLEKISITHHLTIEEIEKQLQQCLQTLFTEREKRIRPGLDDKILTSWNALMIKGHTDAYAAFGEQSFLDTATAKMNFILQHLCTEDGGLFHNYKSGRATINGFLEDYCFCIEALIALYQQTFNEAWLTKAKLLMDYVIKHFSVKDSSLFYFTSDLDSALITRKIETEDNVIPASNSSIAKSLFLLGHYFAQDEYVDQSKKMLQCISNHFVKYPGSFTNWALVAMNQVFPFYELTITGSLTEVKRKTIARKFLPNVLISGTETESKMPLLQNRSKDSQTLLYVCTNKNCLMPTKSVGDALSLISHK